MRYYKKTGIYPINHGMVIRREIAEKHPWAILNLLKAFDAGQCDRQPAAHGARRVSRRDRRDFAGGRQGAAQQPVIRHGIKANRKTLEACAQYSLEQGLTPRLMKLDELFAKSAMDQ